MRRWIVILLGALLLTTACSGPNAADTAEDLGRQDQTPTPVATEASSESNPEPTTAATEALTSTPEEPSATATQTEAPANPTQTEEETDTSTPAPGPTPAATATETPAPTATPAPVESPLGFRVLSYYGHPSTGSMGILGEYDKDTLLSVLRDQAAAYEAADPETPVRLAFEIIATVAQPNPGDDGTYLLYTGDEWIGEYVDFATANDMLIILDLQIGHNTIANEIEQVRHWLALPNVHVALDPEFSTGPDRTPGEFIGEVDGHDVNTAIEMLAEIVAQQNLPPKILIVHQFEHEMIYNKDVIRPLPGVNFVLDMDGFGGPDAKLENYDIFVRQELIEYGGIKLFYNQDDPLIDPATIVNLDPPPFIVIYQ